MDQDITLSVVIPAFNASGLLKRSLDSIARQTILPTEVIVVDDGSVDDTCDVAKSHPIANSVKFTLLKKQNGGQATARNFGILTAASKYIALLDQDDEFCERRVENLLNAVKLYPNATLIFGAVERVFDSDELAASESKLPDFRRIAQPHCEQADRSMFKVLKKTLFQDLIKGNFINPSSSMFPRVIDGKTVLFDEALRYLEDRELFVRLAMLGDFVFIDDIGCRIYRTGKNFSNKSKGVIHAPYFVKVLTGFLDQNFFPDGSLEKQMILNQLSSKVDDLLYFASHKDLKTTISAIKTHRKWTTKKLQAHVYVKRLLYSIFSTLRNSVEKRSSKLK